MRELTQREIDAVSGGTDPAPNRLKTSDKHQKS